MEQELTPREKARLTQQRKKAEHEKNRETRERMRDTVIQTLEAVLNDENASNKEKLKAADLLISMMYPNTYTTTPRS